MFMDEEGNEKLGGGSIGHYVLLPWRSLSLWRVRLPCAGVYQSHKIYRIFNEAKCNIIKDLFLRAV
jgi:hypothetical protein